MTGWTFGRDPGLQCCAGKVWFLYFCGIMLGSNLMLLGQAAVTGGSVGATLLGVLVAVMLPVLPVASAYKQSSR